MLLESFALIVFIVVVVLGTRAARALALLQPVFAAQYRPSSRQS
jgi:hypothetical protein